MKTLRRISAAFLVGAIAAALAVWAGRAALAYSHQVTVVGTISAGGAPVSDMSLLFTSDAAHTAKVSVATDAAGRYAVTLPSVGRFHVGLAAFQSMPVGSLDVAVPTRHTSLDIDLPNTSAVINIDGPTGLASPAQVLLYDRSRDIDDPRLSGVIRPRDAGRPIRGLPPGLYSVVALTLRPALVSELPGTLRVKAGESSGVSLHLVLNAGRIGVSDALGRVLPTAKIRVAMKELLADAAGSMTMASVPPGVPMVVRAPGFMPTCRLAPAANSEPLTIRMRTPTELSADITVGPDTKWPVGSLRYAEDECAVAAAVYDSEILSTQADSVTARIHGLLSGRYVYTAFKDGAGSAFDVPASADIVVTAPKGCNDCTSHYEARVSVSAN